MSYLVKEDQGQLGEESLREVNRLLDEKQEAGNEEMTLSMQFLLDISKKESSSNFELKFCFKISPLISQDLKNFKELMSSIKHNRPWDLEFSLYDSKIKNLVRSVQISGAELRVRHSNEKNSGSKNSLSVKTSLSNRKSSKNVQLRTKVIEQGHKKASNGEGRRTEGRGTRDKEGASGGMGSTEMGTPELKEDGGVEGQESGEDRVERNAET